MLGNTTWNHKVYHLRWVVFARWEMGEILDFFPPYCPFWSGCWAYLEHIPWKVSLLFQ